MSELRVKIIEEQGLEADVMPPPSTAGSSSKLVRLDAASIADKLAENRYKPYKRDDRERVRKKKDDDLDPMDPAAYSDIPRYACYEI